MVAARLTPHCTQLTLPLHYSLESGECAMQCIAVQCKVGTQDLLSLPAPSLSGGSRGTNWGHGGSKTFLLLLIFPTSAMQGIQGF